MKYLVLIVALASSALAQLSPAGVYLGKFGSNDIAVSVVRRDLVGVYHFDTLNGRLEFASGALNSGGRVTMAATTGRIITLTVSGTTASGTIGGVAFTTTLEKSTGPFAGQSFSYSGTSQQVSDLEPALLLFAIMPSGKVIVVYSNSNRGDQGGLGTITSDGVVTAFMTSRRTWTFLFRPADGVAIGQITSPGTTNSTYTLIQMQRAPIVNIATRGTVGGGNILTAGFVITTAAKVLLIRAVGPTLTAFGVTNAQADPSLTLFSGPSVIATNDNWGAAANAADIPAAASQVGAFALAAGGRDAVLLVTLEPGAYTAQVAGTGAAGDALVEVYEVR